MEAATRTVEGCAPPSALRLPAGVTLLICAAAAAVLFDGVPAVAASAAARA
jgi:hypothetical protein